MFISNGFLSFLFMATVVFINADRIRRSPIRGGDEAEPNQFSYAVAIVSPGEEVGCTGGIIGERYILSAAHCVLDKYKKFQRKDFKIIMGTNNYKSDPRATVIGVKQIFVLNSFINQISLADIAILKLAAKLDIEKNQLQVLKMPSNFGSSVGRRGVVAGFGACQVTMSQNGTMTVVESKTFDGKLRFAELEIINKAECRSILKGKGSSNVREFNFLAKFVKKSTDPFGLCYGDSGSPFVYKSRIVLGVLIGGFSDDCDGRVLPSIFIKIENFLNFINSVLNGNITNDICVNHLSINKHSNCKIL